METGTYLALPECQALHTSVLTPGLWERGLSPHFPDEVTGRLREGRTCPKVAQPGGRELRLADCLPDPHSVPHSAKVWT